MYAWRPRANCFFTKSITSGSFAVSRTAVTTSAAIGGLFVESGDIEIAVERLRKGPRDRRGGHDEHVRSSLRAQSSRARCNTPNLCCSSMTMSPRLSKPLDS